MAETEVQLCDDLDGMCDNPAEDGRSKCSACRKRRQRAKRREYEKKHPEKKLGRPRLPPGAPVAAYHAAPVEALTAKGIELADADTSAEADSKFKNIKEQFRNLLRRAIAKREAKKSRTTTNPRSTP